MIIKKIIFGLFFLQIVTFSFSQTDSVLVKGILTDAISRKPIQNYKVVLTSKYGTHLLNTITDNKGRFEFNTEKKKYFLELNNQQYIDKSIYITDTNKVIDLEIILRPRNQRLTNLDIDSTVINSKIKAVAKKFTLDLTDLHEITEPPGVLRGFDFELGDSTIIYLFVDRTSSFRQTKRKLYNQKIIGLGISRKNGEINYYGDGRPYIITLHNKYYEENKPEN
ncbi:MAG: hypothetical protein RLZ33_193 [Bacteroidota bacterium]|jgi:hypothetical protein